MYSKNNICLWSTLLQGGLKAVVWTDVFQVGTTLNSLLDLWGNLKLHWLVKSVITVHVSYLFAVASDNTGHRCVGHQSNNLQYKNGKGITY